MDTPLFKCNSPGCRGAAAAFTPDQARAFGGVCLACGQALAALGVEPAPAPAAAAIDISRWPRMVALPLREFSETSQQPVLKLWCACDVVEMIVRLVAMLAVGELDRRGKLESKAARGFADLVRRPTLGSWVELVSLAAAQLRKDPPSIAPTLPTAVREVFIPFLRGGRGNRTPETAFVELRNRLAHGGGITKTAAATLLRVWEPRLLDFLGSLEWLTAISVVSKRAAGGLVEHRGDGDTAEFPADRWPDLETASGPAGSVWAVRERDRLRLWPLAAFEPPRSASLDRGSTEEEALQVYVRWSETSIQYLQVGSEQAGFVAGDDDELRAFNRLFGLERREPGHYAVAGFLETFHAEAAGFVGRSRDVAALKTCVEQTPRGVIWVSGSPGIGKSFLASRLVAELQQSLRPPALLLPYRFVAGDARCTRDAFLAFAVERLEDWDASAPVEAGGEEGEERASGPAERIRQLIRTTTPARRVVFVVDGLDEVSRLDPGFVAQVVLSLEGPGVTWCCFGRPEQALVDAFGSAGAQEPFPGGLGEMQHEDVRAMLLERIGPASRRLLIEGDKDRGERVVNLFVENVVHHADGLPLYVKHVIDDLLAGKLMPVSGATLPAGLEAYFGELLTRLGVGDQAALPSAIVATLAVARESLTVDEITALLARRSFVRAAAQPAIERAVASLGQIAVIDRRNDGGLGYRLYHHRFREQVLTTQMLVEFVATAREAMADAACAPGDDAATRYLRRQGVSHLVEMGRREEAIALLTSVEHLLERLREPGLELAIRGIGRDWDALETVSDEVARVWMEFWRSREPVLLRSFAWAPVHRVFLQLALEHAGGSPVTAAAKAWMSAHPDATPLMRMTPGERPVAVEREPCLAVLEGHLDFVNACAASADGRLLLSGGGSQFYRRHVVRLWDVDAGACLREWNGHEDNVTAVALASSAPIGVSGSLDGTVRVWHLQDGRCRAVLAGDRAAVCSVAISDDGRRVFAGTSDGQVCLWDVERVACVRAVAAHEGSVRALVLDEGRGLLLSGGADGWVRRWQPGTLDSMDGWHDHARDVTSLAVHPAGDAIASAGADGLIVVRDADGTQARRWAGPGWPAGGIDFTADGQYLVSGCRGNDERAEGPDVALHVWRVPTGEEVWQVFGHGTNIHAVRRVGDRPLMTSGSRDCTLRIWDLSLLGARVTRPGPLGYVWEVAASADGGLVVACGESGEIHLRRRDEGDRRLTIPASAHAPSAVSVSPDASGVYSGGDDGMVRLWRATDGASVGAFQAHRFKVWTVSRSPWGARLATATIPDYEIGQKGANEIRVWSLVTGRRQLLLRLDVDLTDWPSLFSPDGRLLVSLASNLTVAAWDLDSGEQRRVLVPGRIEADCGMALGLSACGRWCARGDENGTVHVWRLRDGKLQLALQAFGPLDYVRDVFFSADGRLLFACSDAGAVRAWALPAGEPVASWHTTAWVTSALVLGASYDCLVGLSNGHVHVVEFSGPLVPGVPFVTAARLWRLSTDSAANSGPSPGRASGAWDAEVTVPCLWCGARAAASAGLLEAIGRWTERLQPGQAPSLELPDRAWADPGLEVDCERCGRRLRVNPWVVEER